jgi:hypothetical protein
VDWSKVNWFAFFPPLFSIYLLFISGLIRGYLRGQVRRAADRGAVTGHEDFVRNVASGWATQPGFINAMLASLVSTISVWSASRSFEGVTLTIILLLLIFAPMLWYIFSHEPDQIESIKFGWRGKFTPAKVCKIVLLLVNVGLVGAIATSQQLS